MTKRKSKLYMKQQREKERSENINIDFSKWNKLVDLINGFNITFQNIKKKIEENKNKHNLKIRQVFSCKDCDNTIEFNSEKPISDFDFICSCGNKIKEIKKNK